MRSARVWPAIALVAALLAGCRANGQGERLGPVERLNAEAGTLGTFTFPYYTDVAALDGGGALVVFMERSDASSPQQEGGARPVVYRRAPGATAPFGGPEFLTPESLRDAISIIPDLREGPDKGELYVTWQARRNTTGEKFVLFRRSTDAGATWRPEHQINSQKTSFIPSLATDRDGGIYAVWIDERKKGFRIFFNRSLDHGETWLPEDVSVAGSDERFGIVISVDIATDGKGAVLVVWEENIGPGRRIHSAWSGDRGATWQSTMVDDGTERLSPSAPRVVFAGDRAIVTWTAASSGKVMRGQLWSDVSHDSGRTWGKDVRVSDVDGGLPPRVHLTATDGVARMVFHAGALRGPWRISYGELGADGAWPVGDAFATVSPTDEQSAMSRYANPRLAVDHDGTLYVTYEEYEKRVLLSRSTDGGRTWTATGEPIHVISDPQSGQAVHFPQVAVADGVAYVTWEVWERTKDTIKTLSDAARKTRPANLFFRRVTYPHR